MSSWGASTASTWSVGAGALSGAQIAQGKAIEPLSPRTSHLSLLHAASNSNQVFALTRVYKGGC